MFWINFVQTKKKEEQKRVGHILFKPKKSQNQVSHFVRSKKYILQAYSLFTLRRQH